MQRLLLSLATLVVASSSMGCAFSSIEVGPPSRPVPVVASKHAEQREIVIEGPFTDTRGIAALRCGVKKNGLGIESIDVHCSDLPGLWLADLLSEGAVRAGFKVLARGTAPGPNTLVVRGSIDQFFVAPEIGGTNVSTEMEIGVKLTVTSPSGLVAERHFFVKGRSPAPVATDANFQAAADDASDQFVRAAVTALDALIERHAQSASASRGTLLAVAR